MDAGEKRGLRLLILCVSSIVVDVIWILGLLGVIHF